MFSCLKPSLELLISYEGYVTPEISGNLYEKSEISYTPNQEIRLKKEKSRTLNVEMMHPSISCVV